MTRVYKLFFVIILLPVYAFSQKMPPALKESAKEPVKYIGTVQPDKHYYDGELRHAVGVHHYQAFRANRSGHPEGGMIGWTYNHAPMLAYWNGKFYLEYLSNLKEEHNPPGRTLLLDSENGRDWSNPRVIFPIEALPEINWQGYHIPAGTPSVMHQRMGFYVSPAGRLLVIGFYSYSPTPRVGPNKGQGLGRVVREIYKNGELGPIYFIRYNRHAGWNENNVTWFPFYKTSSDKGFIDACEALLADKLVSLQWWEMEQANDDHFYTLTPPKGMVPKALCYFHRPDNVVVALWKHQLSALSPDNGLTWTPIVRSKTLWSVGAKVWGQRTEDGRYSLVYNHSASHRNRFPLVITTGADGHTFNNMLCLNGQVAPIRYQGIHKNVGPQYIRGIVEGNGNPPGNEEWITYSMNKEDIWVSKIHVPVVGTVDQNVAQNFDAIQTIDDLQYWNLYIPKWAPISIAHDPFNEKNKCLELRDEEPYDYALAERTFPESNQLTVAFRVLQWQVGTSLLIVEVNDRYGHRPMRLRFDPDWLSVDRGKVGPPPIPFSTGKWYCIKIKLDCEKQSYDLAVEGNWVKRDIPFAEQVTSFERLVFRTGPWRGDVRPLILNGVPETPGLYIEDKPGADFKVPVSEFFVDDVKTE